MNTAELEGMIVNYPISKAMAKVRVDEIRSIPNMLSVFRKVIVNEVPPTQGGFVEYWKNLYPNDCGIGVISRLKRAYLSYVREYHLGFLLREMFKEVRYDELEDIHGVDYTITYMGTKFFIHAWVDTQNGRYWRGIKNYRHEFVGHHVDLPLNLSTGKRVGDFILYRREDILGLRKTMETLLVEN